MILRPAATAPLPLFPYQAYAADIMAARDRFGLHDEMGIGKTATTIGALNRLHARRGIVVAPAMLRENWIKEFRRFSNFNLRLCKGRTIHDFVAWSRDAFDVLITSYELATKWRKDFARNGEFLDFLVFDEAHYLKNSEANRTKEMFGDDACGSDCLLEWACHSYHVTGTPMANDPMDIYTFLRFAKAIDMPSPAFMRVFFNFTSSTYGTRTTVKPEMLATLQQLIQNNSIRRTHSQVGMELPPIWMREVLVDGDTKEIMDVVREYPGLEKAIIDAIEQGGLSFLDAQHIATLRRLVGKAKAAPYAQMLKWELDSGAKKRVVFFMHTEPLEYLYAYLTKHGYKVAVVYGRTGDRQSNDAVKEFMEDPNCDVILINIKKGGVGLTITVGSDIDMFESDWSPAGNAQAIKRVHRYGQENEVTARFITLAKSIDVAVNRIVADKTASIAQVEGSSMNAAPT